MSNEETPERRRHPDYAEGEDDPAAFPQDDEVGRFSEGQEETPDTPGKHHRGRFSEGEEQLGEDDPEKHVEGRFSTGEDSQPPKPVP